MFNRSPEPDAVAIEARFKEERLYTGIGAELKRLGSPIQAADPNIFGATAPRAPELPDAPSTTRQVGQTLYRGFEVTAKAYEDAGRKVEQAASEAKAEAARCIDVFRSEVEQAVGEIMAASDAAVADTLRLIADNGERLRKRGQELVDRATADAEDIARRINALRALADGGADGRG
jgi:hypothetical protein